MARINTVTMENARGLQRLLLPVFKRQYGGILPGIMKILSVDLKIGLPMGFLYNHLHLRKRSPLSRLQREMLATVVNGILGGAP